MLLVVANRGTKYLRPNSRRQDHRGVETSGRPGLVSVFTGRGGLQETCDSRLVSYAENNGQIPPDFLKMNGIDRRSFLKGVLAAGACISGTCARATNPGFQLQDGDTVVFYGDSITNQKLYTVYTEALVLTRFPQMRVRFVHSGRSGDRVSGGANGTVDQRLERDVFPYRPNVATVMLGMNDAGYRPYDSEIFQKYADGYLHIADRIRSEFPKAPGSEQTVARAGPELIPDCVHPSPGPSRHGGNPASGVACAFDRFERGDRCIEGRQRTVRAGPTSKLL
jgi:hypothetical protein